MEQVGPIHPLVVREVGPNEIGGMSAATAAAPPPPIVVTPIAAAVQQPPPSSVLAAGAGMLVPVTEFKKKRGRPRKYEGQGPSRVVSPMPISASIPLSGDYSVWNHSQARSAEPIRKKQKVVFEQKVVFDSADQKLPYTAGSCFTPHLLTVNTGEDVSKKIMSFSQEGSTAICILCASGSISNVTLRQPNSSGGTLTHEGWFDLISLNGSFIVNESNGTKSRAGGMSVALVAPDGRIIAGGLAGLLVAASPVQVVVGTFIHGRQQDQQHHEPIKVKNTRTEAAVPKSLFSYQSNNITFGSGFERSYSNDHTLNFSQVANQTHGSDSKEAVNPTHCEVSC